LTLDDGAVLPFDDLVIATGVRPRTLGGVTPRGVHVLRTLEQSMALRRAMLLGGRGHVVIVGGGFIGLEVAATARKLDVDVTIIEPNPGLLSSRLGSEAADRLRGLHGTHDVRMIIGTGVAGYLEDGNSTVRGLVLSDGTTFEASVVLLAIGSQPNVEWLAGSGLDVTDGVRCDATCLAAPGIWAAGDVARWYHAGLGREIRVEHRLNATEQGLVVAENLVGTPRAFTPTPFFWTDQYDARIQVAGLPTSDSEEHGEQLGPDSFLHSYSVEGRLTAVLGWNAAKAMMPLRRELTASHSELVSS
jgi:NADPH-dependent 2,4-dienoyl-CoA reductase/sulfur reductase-like enzyme